MRKMIDELWLNACDRLIHWLFIHSIKHRDVIEIDTFCTWSQLTGHDMHINYGPDQPYKDRETIT